MVLRVTNVQTTNAFIDQILRNQAQLEDKRNEISSGYKVVDASDDPGRAGTISMLQSAIQRLSKHKDRIAFGINMLETQENIVQTANDILVRAKELATQAASGAQSAETRGYIADEIFQLRDSLVSIANTRHQGIYIYGGLDDDDPPYDLNETYYNEPPSAAPAEESAEKGHWMFDDPTVELGQTDTRTIKISDSDIVKVISRADEIFSKAINSLEILGRSLKGYNTGLDINGEPDGTGTAYNLPTDYAQQTQDILFALDELEDARVNDVENELSSIGARMNHLEQTEQIIDTLKLNTDKARASIQDADMIQAASEFASLQLSLEGLLASGSQINRLSLLDYL